MHMHKSTANGSGYVSLVIQFSLTARSAAPLFRASSQESHIPEIWTRTLIVMGAQLARNDSGAESMSRDLGCSHILQVAKPRI
jgi:hypothetical protein